MSGHQWGLDGLLAATTKALHLADPGNGETIRCKESPQTCGLRSAGAETRTLADPDGPGQQLSLSFAVDGGDIVITASTAVNQAGNTSLTFADAGDHIKLESVEVAANSYAWRIVANDGVALA